MLDEAGTLAGMKGARKLVSELRALLRDVSSIL